MAFLPVFEHDWLAQFRPFPKEETSSLYLNHWHEVVVSLVFYVTLQKLSPIVFSRLLGRTYTDLKLKTKIDFDIHAVAMVQCVVSLLLLLPMWNHPDFQNRNQDHASAVLGYTPYGGFVNAVTLGYFLWDLYVCMTNFQLFGVGFLFHAFAAMFVFLNTFIPFCMPWTPGFLLFEASTPFVNFNWFASRLPAGTFSEKFVVINGLVLIVVFFSVRIVWGLTAVAMVAVDMWAVWDQTGWFLPFSTLFLNFFLNVLNIFWFYKMVRIASKKIRGAKTSQVVKENADIKME